MTNKENDRLIRLYMERNEFANIEAKRVMKEFIREMLSNFLVSKDDIELCEKEVYKGLWDRVHEEKPASIQAMAARIAKDSAMAKNAEKQGKAKSEEEKALEKLESIFDAASLETMDEKVLGNAIDEFLDYCSPEENNLFVSKYWFGIPNDILADKLGISITEVNKKLQNINKKLEKYLKNEEIPTKDSKLGLGIIAGIVAVVVLVIIISLAGRTGGDSLDAENQPESKQEVVAEATQTAPEIITTEPALETTTQMTESVESAGPLQGLQLTNVSAREDLYRIGMASNGDGISFYYDSEGRLNYCQYLHDDLVAVHAYVYDEKGRIKKEYGRTWVGGSEYSSTSANCWIYEYSYPEDTSCVMKTERTPYGEDSVFELHFDELGRMTENIKDGVDCIFYYYVGNERFTVNAFDDNLGSGWRVMLFNSDEVIIDMMDLNDSDVTDCEQLKAKVDVFVQDSLQRMDLEPGLEHLELFDDGSVKSFTYSFGKVNINNTLKISRPTIQDNYKSEICIYNPKQLQKIPLFEGGFWYYENADDLNLKYSTTDEKLLNTITLAKYNNPIAAAIINLDFENQEDGYNSMMKGLIESVSLQLKNKDYGDSLVTENESLRLQVDKGYFITKDQYCIESTITNKTDEQVTVLLKVPYINNVSYSVYKFAEVPLQPMETVAGVTVKLDNYTENLLGIRERENILFYNIQLQAEILHEGYHEFLSLNVINNDVKQIDDRNIKPDSISYVVVEDDMSKIYITNTYIPHSIEDSSIIYSDICVQYYIENNSNANLIFDTDNTTWTEEVGSTVENIGMNFSCELEPGMGAYHTITLHNANLYNCNYETRIDISSPITNTLQEQFNVVYPIIFRN